LFELDVASISAVIAAAGVLVGVVYYVLEMRHQTTIRKTDLLIRLYSTVSSNEFMDAQWKVYSLQVKDYQDYVRQYGSMLSENPMHRAFGTVSGFYESVGTLLYRKLIDVRSIYDVVGSSNPKSVYEKIKPIVSGVRREFDEPGALAGFEYLCDELMRKEPQLKKTLPRKSLPTVTNSSSSNQSSRC
jgi:hypothetical protein